MSEELIEQLGRLATMLADDGQGYSRRIVSEAADVIAALSAHVADIELENKRLGFLLAPEATAAAIRGHQLCMESWAEVNRLWLVAGARVTELEEALKKIGNSPQPDWMALAKHYEEIARAALKSQP